jgi:hypothetical protein
MAKQKTIEEIFREGTEIDKALRKGVRKALLEHKKLGYPIVVARDGKPVWIQPEDIDVDEKE